MVCSYCGAVTGCHNYEREKVFKYCHECTDVCPPICKTEKLSYGLCVKHYEETMSHFDTWEDDKCRPQEEGHEELREEDDENTG